MYSRIPVWEKVSGLWILEEFRLEKQNFSRWLCLMTYWTLFRPIIKCWNKMQESSNDKHRPHQKCQIYSLSISTLTFNLKSKRNLCMYLVICPNLSMKLYLWQKCQFSNQKQYIFVRQRSAKSKCERVFFVL